MGEDSTVNLRLKFSGNIRKNKERNEMLKTSVKWGGISGAALIAVIVIGEMVMGGSSPDNFAASEIFGYLTFVACLGLIFLALSEARQSHVTLWQKILLGLAVSVVAGIMFGIYNVIYTTYINPSFMDEYYNHFISQLPMDSGPEYDIIVADLEAQKEMFMNPIIQFFAMAATVIAVGIPESVILALIHKKMAS